MSERFNVQKEIETLAIITNNGFNAMFGLHNEQAVKVDVLTGDIDLLKHDVAEIKRDVELLKIDVSQLKIDVTELKKDVCQLKVDVAELKQDMSIVKTSILHINQKLDLILDNMVTKQEFQSLVQRTERLELA